MSKNTCPKSEVIEKFGMKHAGLSFSFQCNPERCKNPAYFTEYLCFNALSDDKTGMSLTFVMCEYEGKAPTKIMGFISLKATSLLYQNDEGQMEGYPALEIAELAVDQSCEGRGKGTDLLKYALVQCDFIRNDHAAVRYLVVCATEEAAGFYLKERPTVQFGRAEDRYVIPREIWNDSCIPLYLKLPEKV